MINPYKAASKINPQTASHGFRIFAKPIFDALIRAKLAASEYKVSLSIIGRTWGYQKKSDIIPVFIIQLDTGLCERSVRSAIRSLYNKRIIYFIPSSRIKNGSPINEFLFNKHFDTWLVDKSVDKVVDNFLTGAERRKAGVQNLAPVQAQTGAEPCTCISKTNIVKQYNIKSLTSSVFTKSEYETDKLIQDKLNKSATKETIIRVLKMIDQQLWWKVQRFLITRWKDGAKAYDKAVIEYNQKEVVSV